MEFINSNDTIKHLIYLIENKISKNYLRFGDGDFYLMEGQYDMLAVPSQEIISSYNKLITVLNPNDMISVPFYCNSLNTLEQGMKPGVHEYPDHQVQQFIHKITQMIPQLSKLYSHVALHQAIAYSPELYFKFLQAIIKNNSTIILGNKDFSFDKIEYFFGKITYIGANANNSYFERERLWKEFSDTLDTINDFTVCILALGCGGRAMSHQFIEDIQRKNKKVLIIDIGSSIDVLMGFRHTRAWVELTDPNINIIEKYINNFRKNIDQRPIESKQLTNLGLKYGTDKCTYHNYTDFYESLFHYNKDNVKLFFEVGVASGASIKMWRDYFKNSTIHCFDYDINLSKNVANLQNVFFHYTNQESKDSLKASLNGIPLNSADIIIDDGGHFSSQQRNTIEVFWPYLKSGGIYIIEDIHTNMKHWYPNPISWNNNKYYWDETPTVFETLSKLQIGLPLEKGELNISTNEIKQLILWSQPHTTSAVFILIKK